MSPATIRFFEYENEAKAYAKELEKIFVRKSPIKYPQLKEMVAPSDFSEPSPEAQFVKVLKSVSTILKSEKSTENNINTINKISAVERILKSLTNSYTQKYQRTIELTMLFFSSGIIVLLLETLFTGFFVTASSFLLSLPSLIWIIIIINKLIEIHKVENKLQQKIINLEILLED